MGNKYSSYKYYDTPDGEDYGRKTYYLVKQSMTPAYFMAHGNILLISQPVGLVPTLVKWFSNFYVIPGACIVFSTTAYMATKLRGKDVASNHFLAGIATMIYLNKTLVNNWAISTYVGIPVSFAMYCFKQNKLIGISAMPDMINMREDLNHGVLSHYYNTYTLQKRYPRDWLYPEEAVAQKQT